MALLTKVGTFTPATSTGAQAITGVGFLPKALILTGSGNTTAGSWNNHVFHAIGFSDGVDSWCESAAANQGTTNAVRHRIENTIFVQNNTNSAGIVRRASLDSFDADGFTLDWSVVRANGDYDTLHYIALGGDDVDATVLNWQSLNTTGSQAVTGAGFEPNLVLHIFGAFRSSLHLVSDDSTTAARVGFGAADGSNQFAYVAHDYSPTIAYSAGTYTRTNGCIQFVTNSGATAAVSDGWASHDSFDADGFTVDWQSAPSSTFRIASLCLSVPYASVSSLTKSTSSAPVTQSVTGLGFDPSLVLMGGTGKTGAGQSGGFGFSLGASDGTDEFVGTSVSTSTASRSSVAKTDKGALVSTSGSTTAAEADLDLVTDGFDLTWTTNSGSATYLHLIAIGVVETLAGALDSDAATAAESIVLATLAGGATSASAVDGALSLALALPLSATVASSSDAAGTLVATETLGATLVAASSTSAAAAVAQTVAGASASTTALDGVLAAGKPLEAVATGSSDATGALDVSGLALAAAVAATSDTSGAVIEHAGLAAVIESTTGVYANPGTSTAFGLTGILASSSAVVATSQLAMPAGGAAASSSGVSADTLLAVTTSGVVSGDAAVSATLAAALQLEGEIESGSAIAGNATIATDLALTGTLEAGSALDGVAGLAIDLAGESDSAATAAGAVDLLETLTGAVTAGSATTGSSVSWIDLAGELESGSDAAGALSAAMELALDGLLASGSQIAGVLASTRIRELTATRSRHAPPFAAARVRHTSPYAAERTREPAPLTATRERRGMT